MGFHKPGEIRAAFALGRGLAPKGREKYRSCCRAGKDRDIDTVRRSADRRKKDGKKERKRVLREMKRIVTVVRGHARRYHTLLDENWQATDWSRPQAEQVLKRIESVIEALPVAVKQAHERIIGERPVANEEKTSEPL
jgi:hypothetical protein